MVFRMRSSVFYDAACRATWIWKSYGLNGRKAFSRLFFRVRNRTFFHSFLLNQNQRKTPFPIRSPPVFYPLRRYENKWNFHNWCQLKARCTHEDFAAKGKNRWCYFWIFCKSGFGSSGAAISFSSLCSDFTLLGVFIFMEKCIFAMLNLLEKCKSDAV